MLAAVSLAPADSASVAVAHYRTRPATPAVTLPRRARASARSAARPSVRRPPLSATGPRHRAPVALLYGGAALLVLIAFVGGNIIGRRAEPASTAADAPGVPLTSGAMQAGLPTAPDISAMSPEERANRLFNRVMLYSEQGKLDSARFFAPMAIQAYEMIGVRDAHEQYDIGVISAAVGDVARARAEADTILAAHPKHLLGLVLAARAAELARDSAAAALFTKRLVAAAPTERASALKEYGEHARDIDDDRSKRPRCVNRKLDEPRLCSWRLSLNTAVWARAHRLSRSKPPT